MIRKIADINVGDLEGLGPLGKPKNPFTTFDDVISNIISIMTVIAAIWFIFVLVTGAISWISSGGDKQKVEEARKKISHGLIGIAVVVAAIFLIEIVGKFLGLDMLNPGNLLKDLIIK